MIARAEHVLGLARALFAGYLLTRSCELGQPTELQPGTAPTIPYLVS